MRRLIIAFLALLALSAEPRALDFALPEIGIQPSGACCTLSVRDRSNNAMVPFGCLDTTAHAFDFSTVMRRASGAGARLRSMAEAARDRLSVADFTGFDPTGAADGSTAFQAAYDAAAPSEQILIPKGVYKPVTVTGTKWVRWLASGASVMPGAALFDLPGTVSYGFGALGLTVQTRTAPTDLATISIRRQTSHTGGTPGFVSSAFRVDHTVGSPTNRGATNYEWAGTFVMNSYADAGENVPLYGQGNKWGIGPIWGMVSEVYERLGTPNPVSGTVPHEFDINAYGTDDNNNRIFGDHVLRNPIGAPGALPEAYAGLRFQGDAGSIYKNFLVAKLGQQFRQGIDLSAGTMLQGGAGMRLAGDMPIFFEPNNGNGISYNATPGLGRMEMKLSNGLALRSVASVWPPAPPSSGPP